jgi:S-adenosylmethionine-diacylgycerolhomoserine-N-methlytransferase
MSGAVGLSQADAMDRMYRVTRHVYDLTRKPYLLGRDRMIAGLDAGPGMTVLEVGCGTARNLVAVGRRYPGARLHGFDISQEMLKTAERNARVSGQEIRLAQGDATVFDAGAAFGVAQFDRVYVSYALSMIPPWRQALARALDLVAPGGTLSVVDFGFCEGLGPLARLALHGWLGLFHVSPRAELEEALTGLATRSGRRLHFERVFGGYAQIGRLGPAGQ